MAAPAVAAVLLPAAQDVAGRIGEGVAGLFGDTATDKQRKQTNAAKLAEALAGNEQSLAWLVNRAFERRPDDGKYPPKDVINLARAALRTYYARTGTTPPPQYASQLGITIPESAAKGILSQITTPVLQTIGTTAVDAAEQRIGERARAIAPQAIVVGVIAIAIVAGIYLATRRSA